MSVELIAIPDYTHEEMKQLLGQQVTDCVNELCDTFPEMRPAELYAQALTNALNSEAQNSGHVWWLEFYDEMKTAFEKLGVK